MPVIVRSVELYATSSVGGRENCLGMRMLATVHAMCANRHTVLAYRMEVSHVSYNKSSITLRMMKSFSIRRQNYTKRMELPKKRREIELMNMRINWHTAQLGRSGVKCSDGSGAPKMVGRS